MKWNHTTGMNMPLYAIESYHWSYHAFTGNWIIPSFDDHFFCTSCFCVPQPVAQRIWIGLNKTGQGNTLPKRTTHQLVVYFYTWRNWNRWINILLNVQWKLLKKPESIMHAHSWIPSNSTSNTINWSLSCYPSQSTTSQVYPALMLLNKEGCTPYLGCPQGTLSMEIRIKLLVDVLWNSTQPWKINTE